MIELSTVDLYLAWRQAKAALYYERRGVGLSELARFETALPVTLTAIKNKLAGGKWFDDIVPGSVWVVPKRLNTVRDEEEIVRVGPVRLDEGLPTLDVQIRLSPSPEFAIAELIYLRRFGPALDSLLSKNSIGYRLDLRNEELDPTSRWTFDFWPRRYKQFRAAPLNRASQILEEESRPVVIVSADLAAFYDSIDPSFLLSDSFVARMASTGKVDPADFRVATKSLMRAFARFRRDASSRLGQPVRTGVPIGGLTSRVIANLALSSLDDYIESRPGVLTYRRYVDDLVIVAHAPENVSTDSVLRMLLPVAESTKEKITLDVRVLDRIGCEFELQRGKTRIHHLHGSPGLDFVRAVLADFDKLVSRDEAFLDSVALMNDGATHLIRASEGEGSPLRVLRDADRVRLERFALSTSLKTLERASVLLDIDEAQQLVRSTIARLGSVLGGGDDWVESLDAALRLLRLAVSNKDWVSFRSINSRFEAVFGSVETLRAHVGVLRYRGTEIPPNRASPWTSLRNFLHERRLESVASAFPSNVSTSEFSAAAPGGLVVRTKKVGQRALTHRARELAFADLRSNDREDDCDWSGLDSAHNWMEDQLPELAERFGIIRGFHSACEALRDRSWLVAPARLYLSTRPPSYFDVARRLLYREGASGKFSSDIFDRLLAVVNSIRGTRYRDAIGKIGGDHTVAIPWIAPSKSGRKREVLDGDPQVVLGNFVATNDDWARSAKQSNLLPRGRLERLLGLNKILSRAASAARSQMRSSSEAGPTLLVLPELSVPRRWFRSLAHHVVRHGGFGAVVGLEYLHDPLGPWVVNQAFAVLPGPFGSVATWPWTKRFPADDEGKSLAKLTPSLSFKPIPDSPRIVVETSWGRFSTLICSELFEPTRISDLFGRTDLVLCPAWNTDTASYDHLVQSAGFQLHAVVAIANNGHYSDCRSWAPLAERWERDLCRLIERDENDIVQVRLPMRDLAAFHRSGGCERSR